MMPRSKKKQTEEQNEEQAQGTSKAKDKKKVKPPWEPWEKSRAKQWLKKWFKDGSIPVEYSKTDGGLGPRKYWDDLCAQHPDFGGIAGMKYDEAFTRRLGAVQKDFIKKADRATHDQASFDNYRQSHPVEAMNQRGEPRWEGSIAQAQLKKDIQEQYHVGKLPKELWEDEGESRNSYKDYPLKVFRDHIYQEIRLRKWQYYTIKERKKKGDIKFDADSLEEDADDVVEVDDEAIEVVDGEGRLVETGDAEDEDEDRPMR